jgi:hypothetical protein
MSSNTYYLNMSAWQARKQGLPVPDDIPDCAILRLMDEPIDVGVSPDDPMKIIATVKLAWSWVESTFTLPENPPKA